MANNKCSLTCNTVGNNGEVKVSKLWESLMKFFKQDRKASTVHYFLSKDSAFLSENSDILKFDVDGEVTLESLKKALERGGQYENLSDGMTLTYLNRELKKEIGKEYLDYSVALDNVLKFNRSDQFRENFMATLEPTETGKYTIKVVKRNSADEYKLSQYVRDKLVTDALRTILRRKGLDVEFVNNPKIGLKYSTYTDYTIDGYRAIGQVLNGINTSDKVAEIAGHFAISIMKDNPSTESLVKRFLAQLTPEVQEKLFKDRNSDLYRESFMVSEDSAEEAAGILLGRELVRPFKNADSSLISKGVKSVIKGIKNYGGLKWLAKKLISALSKWFIGEDPYLVDKLSKKAEIMAAGVANGFLANAENLDGDAAFLDKNKKAYSYGNVSKHLSEEVRRNVSVFYDSLNDLKNAITEVNVIVRRSGEESDRKLRDSMKELAKDVANKVIPELNLSVYADQKSIEGIINILQGVTTILDKDIRGILNKVQPSDRVNSYVNVSYNARNMKIALTAMNKILILYDNVSKKLDSMNPDITTRALNITDAEGHTLYMSLREAVSKLGDVLIGNAEEYKDTQNKTQNVRGLQRVIELKMRQVFIDAYSNFFGRDYIERNAGVIWYQKNIGGKRRLLRSDAIEGYNRKNIKDLIETMENDISLIDRYICSASDCGDFVTAVGDKVVKEANNYADKVVFRFWDRIEAIRLQMEDAFGHTDCRPFYETIEIEENGKKRTVLSGNLLDKVNHGAWEEDMRKFKEQLNKDWRQHIRDEEQRYYKAHKSEGDRFMVYAPSDNELGLKYHEFVDEKWEKWHSVHSKKVWVEGGKKYVPNDEMYKSLQWINTFGTDRNILPDLTDEEIADRQKKLKVYLKILELKSDMDALLAKNAAVSWRAPQMTGRFGHRFRNLKLKFGNKSNALKSGAADVMIAGKIIKKECEDLLVVKPEDGWIFGSNNTFNEIEEDPLGNYDSFEREKIERLPVYGIRKLKNMEDLSTDLFGSLLRYGSMAATYNSMERVVDVFELGKDVLKSRDKKWQALNNKSEESRAYSRYIKFIEKGVYNIGVTIPNMIFNKDARKFLTNLSTIGGRILLYGNAHGGVVNTGTGVIEILKEAMAGENFDTTEAIKANKMFFDEFWKTALEGLADTQRPMSKNALWIRHWNILSENKSFLNNQKFDAHALSLLDNRLGEWFNHTMMLPYSSGDFYMQTVPYYAMGIHEKVYDRNGNEMKLMDAYDIVDGDAVYPIDRREEPMLGRTPRSLRLKNEIFRSREDIIDYGIVQGMLNKIANYYANNSKLKDNDPVALNLFDKDEIEFLEDSHFAIPEKVKHLADLERALTSKSKNLLYNESDEAAFMLKCRNICNRLHGIYNSEDKVALQQNLYGNLVMSMRGYALGMYNRRYSENKYNVPQMKNVEGSSNTFFKVLCYAFKNIDSMDNWQGCAEAMLYAIPGLNLSLFSGAYGERVKADMMRAGFSEHQYYNVRRFGADYLAIETLLLGKFLTSPGIAYGLRKESEDDEDENSVFNTIKGIVYYLFSRWNREQQAFSTPWGLKEESPSLLDYLPAGLSGFATLLDLIWLYTKTKIDQRAEADMTEEEIMAHRKDNKLYWQRKENGHEKYEAKYKEKFLKLTPYYRTYYVWGGVQSPYKSASAYDNGRKMRGK